MQVLWTCLLSILSLHDNVIRTFSLSYLFPSSFVVVLYPWTAYDDAAHQVQVAKERENVQREKKRERKGGVLRAYSRIRCDWALGRVRADLTPTKVP